MAANSRRTRISGPLSNSMVIKIKLEQSELSITESSMITSTNDDAGAQLGIYPCSI